MTFGGRDFNKKGKPERLPFLFGALTGHLTMLIFRAAEKVPLRSA